MIVIAVGASARKLGVLPEKFRIRSAVHANAYLYRVLKDITKIQPLVDV
jgi:hypothetical protein